MSNDDQWDLGKYVYDKKKNKEIERFGYAADCALIVSANRQKTKWLR